MEIEIILNGERKKVDLKSLKGREIDGFINVLMKFQTSENVGESFPELQDNQKALASKISGLSVEELDDLDVDDRAKIYDYINSKIEKAMGFGNLLQK